MIEMVVVERKRSRGGFLNLFDWPGKSRKKLFSSSTSELSEPKQTKHNAENLSSLSLIEVDEKYCRISDSICCASSVTSDDVQGTRAPSVVARLMGLESLPVPNVQERRFNPDLDPFFSRPSRNTNRWNAYENLGYVNLHSDYNGVSWEHLDSRMNDGRNHRLVERFQSETFPPRSAKPISVANNRLLSPIRSPGVVPSRNLAYVMEAASRMIEPSPRMVTRTRFSPSDSPSSVPMRIRDLREKLEAAKKVSSREVPNNTFAYPSGKHNEKRASTSVTAPSTKSKAKPPYVSAQAKASTTPLTVTRNSTSHKEKAEPKRRIVKSQNGLRGPPISKQNEQKQNCRDTQRLVTLESKVINKVTNKVPAESGSISKQSGLITASAGKNTSLSLSRKKNLSRSKKPSNGMQERGENLIKCNITIGGGLNSGKDDQKKEVDVISFTFSSPVKGLSSDSLSSTQGIDQDTETAVSFDMFGGNSLNVLLEQKLRELTSKLEGSSCSLTQEESSRSSAKDGVNGMFSSSSEYDKSTQNGLDKVLSECESVSNALSCTEIIQSSSESVITLTYSEDDEERLDWEVEDISKILGSDQLMVKEFVLGMATDILPASLFNEMEGCGEATAAKVKRKTVFDFVNKYLALKCEKMFRGSCRGILWRDGVLFERRDWLAEELNREIHGLKKMRGMMMDELVDKDMSSFEGSWLDFEREAYEEGVDIEGVIVSTLVDDLVNDLVSVFKEEH